MPKKYGTKRPADMNKLAMTVVDRATKGGDDPLSAKRAEAGRKGGKKRAEMDPAKRKEIADKANKKRWED